MTKKTLTALLALLVVLMFAGCAKDQAEPTTEPPTIAATEAPTETPTEVPTEPPTEPPTEEPTEPPATNPLTGEAVSADLDTRIFCATINNVKPALPHRGLADADIYFEMYVNDYCTRGLALYADIESVKEIGSIRSLRYNFTDIAKGYDAIIAHAGGSKEVMADEKKSKVDNLDANTMGSGFHRDSARKNAGYAWEHTLFAYGTDLMALAVKQGYDVTIDPEKDFGMRFIPDGTPAGGETANTVKIDFILYGHSKVTNMVYNTELGAYVYNQYNMQMKDENTGTLETFENVFVLLAKTTNDSKGLHVSDIEGSGEGYYACGGRIIPITWHRESDFDTFSFKCADGSQLEQGVGNSYVAIAPTTSKISWS